MATATAAEPELKTYWCHECDMSVALTSSASPPLLCPHCHTHFLELMDSPFAQNDAEPPFPSNLFFDTPFLHRLIHRQENDVVGYLPLEDPLALLSSPTTLPSKPRADSIPIITVTPSLLSQLDPKGVVLCAVCKDEIGVDAEAKQLPCNHLYHSDCITPWLAHHSSCPLCRFRLEKEEEEEEDDDDDGGASRARELRRQLMAAMVRLSELMEEEEEQVDFYGLRTTLNHIATRHGLLEPNGSRVREVGDDERGVFGSTIGGRDGQPGLE